MSIPTGLTPDLIGKVVSVQIFMREETNSDNIDRESMRKHVGTLEMYYHDQNEIVFKLVGGESEASRYEDYYLEIHPYTKVNKYQFG